MEADWKKFRASTEKWRERYIAECNARIARILANPKKTETVRFWEAEELILQEAKTLRRCLDDLRRSTMSIRLMEMRAAGMIRREDLADFSEETQTLVFREFPARG